MFKFSLFLVLSLVPWSAWPSQCPSVFTNLEYSGVTAWALSHSRFSSLKEVKAKVYDLVETSLINKKSAKEFEKALRLIRTKDPGMSLRYKFIFNAIETATKEWSTHNLSDAPSLVLQKLTYIAIWATVFPMEPIGRLAMQNHFGGHKVENLLQDRLLQAEVHRVFHQFAVFLKELDVNGKAGIDRFVDPSARQNAYLRRSDNS